MIFHPRRHKWSHHFRSHGGELIGRTAIGRTTVEVLQINRPELVALRELLMEGGLSHPGFPPLCLKAAWGTKRVLRFHPGRYGSGTSGDDLDDAQSGRHSKIMRRAEFSSDALSSAGRGQYVLCRPAIPAVKREGEEGEGISHPPRPAVVPVPDMGKAQPSEEAELPMTGIPGPPGLISGPPLPRAVHRRSTSAQG